MSKPIPGRVYELLSEIYVVRFHHRWLHLDHKVLGGQPVDLIDRGESDKVIAYLEGLADGVMG